MKSRPRWMGAATISLTSAGQGRRRSQACAVASLKSRCTHTKSTLSPATSTSAKSHNACPTPLRNSKANSGRPSLTFCNLHPTCRPDATQSSSPPATALLSVIEFGGAAQGRKLAKCARRSPRLTMLETDLLLSSLPLACGSTAQEECRLCAFDRLRITGQSLGQQAAGFLGAENFARCQVMVATGCSPERTK